MATQLELLRQMSPEELATAHTSGFHPQLIAQVQQEAKSREKVTAQGAKANDAYSLRQLLSGDYSSKWKSPLGQLARRPEKLVDLPAPIAQIEQNDFSMPPEVPGRAPAPVGYAQDVGLGLGSDEEPERPMASNSTKSIVPRFALDAGEILDRLNGKPREAATLPEVEKPEMVDAVAPEFKKGYGEVNPWASVAQAGLGILSTPGGLSGLQAIGQGGKEGLASYERAQARADAQQKEMRDAQFQHRQEQRGNQALERQYNQDLIGRAKSLYEMRTGDEKLDEEKKRTVLQAMQLSQQGQYQEAYLKLQESEIMIKYPGILRDPVKGLKAAASLMRSDNEEDRQLGEDIRRIIMSRADAAMGGVDVRREQILLNSAQKILADPAAPADQRERAAQIIRQIQQRSMGMSIPAPSGPPNITP